MRAHEPGGRFSVTWELDEIGNGITYDSTNPYGTVAEWWIFKSDESFKDPIYDVEPIGTGRVWDGPHDLYVISASITHGNNQQNQRGFYSADALKLTLNIDDLQKVSPELFFVDRGFIRPQINFANKYRVVWQNQVYRPRQTQTEGYVDDRGTIIVLDCIQVMPEEMVNDSQFALYAQP